MVSSRTLLTLSLLFPSYGPPLGPSTLLLVQERHREDPRFDSAATREFDAHLARIRDEIAKAGTGAWAGRYYMGDGLGTNVVVEFAPMSGFAFTWHGCLGLYDRNYGTAAAKDGCLELAFRFPNIQEGYRGLAPELIPVKWGERRYLIARDELLFFANDVNGGCEPRERAHGRSLLRMGDEAKRVEGKPELPKEAAEFLLDHPVAGTLVSVHETGIETIKKMKFRMTAATIDRGADEGLRVGHSLHFQGKESQGADGTVVELAAHTARIRIRAWGGEKAPMPKPGWKWSTSDQVCEEM